MARTCHSHPCILFASARFGVSVLVGDWIGIRREAVDILRRSELAAWIIDRPPVCCANIQSRIENLKEFPQHSAIFPLLVHQRSPSAKNRPVVIGFEPVIEMHLIEVGSHEFFSQSFIISTYEGYGETRAKSNCELEDVVGIGGAVRIACLHLAQCCRDDQQAMWVVAYPFEAMNEDGPLESQRMHKVEQGLVLDHTPIRQAGNGIVTQLQRLFLNPSKRAFKS